MKRQQITRRDRTDEFASFTPRPRTAQPRSSGIVSGICLTDQPGKWSAKTLGRRQQNIRDSARGEECTVRIVGVCNRDPTTTVWSHAPFSSAGKGGALKGLDILGCYCCSACHDVVDGRAPRPAAMTREQALLDWFFGMARSIVILRQKGLV